MLTTFDIENIISDTLNELKIEIKDGNLLDFLDSIELVTFVLSLEEKLTLRASIVSADTFSKSRSPFKTVKTLVEYLDNLR